MRLSDSFFIKNPHFFIKKHFTFISNKVTVEDLFTQLEGTTFSIEDQPYSSLFKLFKKEFLENSVQKGLIDNSHLSIAGDGTPVVTSARERKHRVCDCAEKGITDCDCERYFSQPDCDIGWDSSRDCMGAHVANHAHIQNMAVLSIYQ